MEHCIGWICFGHWRTEQWSIDCHVTILYWLNSFLFSVLLRLKKQLNCWLIWWFGSLTLNHWWIPKICTRKNLIKPNTKYAIKTRPFTCPTSMSILYECLYIITRSRLVNLVQIGNGPRSRSRYNSANTGPFKLFWLSHSHYEIQEHGNPCTATNSSSQ